MFSGIVLILISLPLMFIPILGIPLFIIGVVRILSTVGKGNANDTAKATAREFAKIEQIREQKKSLGSVAHSNNESEKWAALVKYDDTIRAAVQQLEPYGKNALEKFKSIYLALDDKSKIPHIVADLHQEFASNNNEPPVATDLQSIDYTNYLPIMLQWKEFVAVQAPNEFIQGQMDEAIELMRSGTRESTQKSRLQALGQDLSAYLQAYPNFSQLMGEINRLTV